MRALSLKMPSARVLLWPGAAVLGVLVALPLGLVAAGPPAPAFATHQEVTPPARLTVTSLSPDLLLAGSVLRVTGTVQNAGPAPLTGVEVRLNAVGTRLGTRVEVDRWLDGGDQRVGLPVLPAGSVGRPIPPGGQAPFTIEVPAAALGLPTGEFGAYPITVEARADDGAGGRGQVALLRSTVQAQPAAKEYEEQQITWVLPFSGLPGTSVPVGNRPDATLAQLAHEVGPGSRLRRMLDVGVTPGVVWAVDPQLLVALGEVTRAQPPQAGPGTPTRSTPAGTTTTGTTTVPPPSSPGQTPTRSDPTPTQQSTDRNAVRDFLRLMRAEAPRHEVIALPYADPDLQALNDTRTRDRRAMDLLAGSQAAGSGVIEDVLGVTPVTDLAWPAGGRASDSLVRSLADRGYRSVLLDGATRPLVDALGYTPDARTTTLPDEVVGVLGDRQLSNLAASVSGTNTTARGRLLAETAAATTESPGLSRRLVLAIPRGAIVDPAALRATVTAAAQSPWLRPVPLTRVLRPADDRDTSGLARRVAAGPASTGVTAQDVLAVLQLRSGLAALGEVVERPVQTTAELQRGTLDLLSAGWRDRHRDLTARQQAQRAKIGLVTGRVGVLPTQITFLRNSGEVQLTVSNDLDQPVTGVRLRVSATDRRLVVDEAFSRPLDLGPRTRASVRVPVTALASGEVRLQAQLVAPSGEAVGALREVQVRVRPTDSWVVTVGGALAAIVLVIGLVRAVRRPRRRGADEPNDHDTDQHDTDQHSTDQHSTADHGRDKA